MKRLTAALLALLLCAVALPGAQGEDTEFSYGMLVPQPHVSVLAPTAMQSYDTGGTLRVRASGVNVVSMQATLTHEGASWVYEVDGALLDHVFDTPQFTGRATVTVTGFGAPDEYGYPTAVTRSVTILSPREKLFADMFALALKNSRDPYYRHAPAQEDWDRGVCKNFVMRLFDTYKGAYAMKEYPELAMHMPLNNSKVNCAPYDYGVEWRIESAADGSPFEIAASFRYDKSLSQAENEALCRAVMEAVQTGDFFQMAGDYYYGNGPHSLLFMADYDPVTDTLHWTDSNMKHDRVDGVQWGYLQYDAVNTAAWFVKAICMRNRGCTLYRLRDDLYVK